MAKITKYFELFSVLKSGADAGVSPAAIAKSLRFAENSVPVYIHALRHKFGADIQSVRDGRKVVAYKLMNIKEVEDSISPNRKPRTTKTKIVEPVKPVKIAKVAKPVKVAKVAKPVKVKVKVAKVTKVSKSTDGSIPTLDSDLDITEITSADFDDIKSQLGLA